MGVYAQFEIDNSLFQVKISSILLMIVSLKDKEFSKRSYGEFSRNEISSIVSIYETFLYNAGYDCVDVLFEDDFDNYFKSLTVANHKQKICKLKMWVNQADEKDVLILQ